MEQVNFFLSLEHQNKILDALKVRFQNNSSLHKGIEWDAVRQKLEIQPKKIWSLQQMEDTGGEPNVTGFDTKTNEYVICDCSAESPKGRRSLCYDREALNARKEFKPQNTALDMANAMGVELLSEEQYRSLQKLGRFDVKTSSWLSTPDEVRKRGGAIFGDRRYERVFIYHNGAESYYAARGFRGLLKI